MNDSGAYEARARVSEWIDVYERCGGNERLACGYREVPLLLSDIKTLLTLPHSGTTITPNNKD